MTKNIIQESFPKYCIEWQYLGLNDAILVKITYVAVEGLRKEHVYSLYL